MDAFSSSLFSKFQHPELLQWVTKPRATTMSPNAPIFTISSVRIEEKPEKATNFITRQEPSKTETQLGSVASSSTEGTTTGRRFELSIPATIFNGLDDIINNFIDPPRHPSIDPKHVLADNFAPVDELPPTDCPIIEGTLPPCLDGVYIRNGPNPQYQPRGPYHLFDGDGMLHSLRISQGRATFCSRYVHTYKYSIEREAGFPILPNIFASFHGLMATVTRGAVTAGKILTGQFNPINGIGLANTSLAFFGNQLFALGESDLPYAIRLTPDGDVQTIGRWDSDKQLSMSMTAHPKIDADTGEAFAFRYNPMRRPFVTYFRFDANGSKHPDVPIFSMAQPSFLHDFAITKKYVIFTGMELNPIEMIVRGGCPVRLDPKKVPRIGVIPRYAQDETEIRWFDVPGFNIIHTINAWDDEEDEDTIVLIAPSISSEEKILDRIDLMHMTVEKMKMDLRTGAVSRYILSARNLDFGVLNPAFVGKKSRYAYMAVGDPMPKISGVVKLDLDATRDLEGRRDCVVSCRTYEPGCYGGEPFFVGRNPRSTEPADEDDGYLVSYVHDENTGESRFLVMDARSPTLEVVATVKLPRRVPYGFHGLFVGEDDLRNL
ncbi:PREDICTED: probable carotenoid cleavage dioxygenase 4, chloroplastic [Nelumbo nucifera]|uniref:Carotenoid cleavage dioxygenase 4, chloroplastic n=2 Tax=Nelumbo nucifera TaxID=4432 RepID=A0A822XXJ6_NELNU|nr:PREDICTED: probable carotenoid cleavage dioxygenase 4, chloroplastic [Nelumbo nucifera]DAD25060.1 TPA_asm: hypothetical protein HUJ06_026524 [Nelumbo nucifera]